MIGSPKRWLSKVICTTGTFLLLCGMYGLILVHEPTKEAGV